MPAGHSMYFALLFLAVVAFVIKILIPLALGAAEQVLGLTRSRRR